jgi:hypothetical protein
VIRVVDERIFSMTRDEHAKLSAEYERWRYTPLRKHAYKSFEQWLADDKKLPYTTYTEENP